MFVSDCIFLRDSIHKFVITISPGVQRHLIIISRTEGLMCQRGINRRYSGDHGMAGLKLPKLCVVELSMDIRPKQNNYVDDNTKRFHLNNF